MLPSPLAGPAFGSYPTDDVRWLLSDLSRASLEAPREQRERAIQLEGAHYSESLPIEYQPPDEYVRLFRDLTLTWAPLIATLTAALGERILRSRTESPFLVSLARAGTPVGILVRRWLRFRHGLDVPHVSVSIIRDRGLDPVALAWLCRNAPLQSIVFIDGWTGKGAIARQLKDSLRAAGLVGPGFGAVRPELAVLADPAHATSLYGTRDDVLVPSACLNATVSGLVSRTVLRPDLTGPDNFHGAKFYSGLSSVDESLWFLDQIEACFPSVSVSDELTWAGERADWRGWTRATRMSVERGVHNVHHIKPGLGETTRVLLRRSPQRVIVKDLHHDMVRHLRLLAADLNVPVEVEPKLPYLAMGIVERLGP